MIDVKKDFISDVPGYVENLEKNGLHSSCKDPDVYSKLMQEYHRELWSAQKLPNGQNMELKAGCGSYYLYWRDLRFGADSIVNMYFHHKGAQSLLNEEIKQALMKNFGETTDFKDFVKKYLYKTYTIGGSIIFLKNGVANSINIRRYSLLKDRFDLALECIRRYYKYKDKDESSPMSKVLKANASFFYLFGDFKEYVDFFFLQDLVNNDYTKINYFNSANELEKVSYPKTEKDWLDLYKNQMDFVEKRNERIRDFVSKMNLNCD